MHHRYLASVRSVVLKVSAASAVSRKLSREKQILQGWVLAICLLKFENGCVRTSCADEEEAVQILVAVLHKGHLELLSELPREIHGRCPRFLSLVTVENYS